VAQAREGCAPEQGRIVQCIKPSDTDASIKRFDRVHYVLFNQSTPPSATLLVFLPGTFGKPPGPRAFLHAAADAGYRVISLDYNDEPAVNSFCPKRGPSCSAAFRRMRVYGDGISIDPSFDNTRSESIVNRLLKLLVFLDREEPQQNWAAYLDNGALNWSRIAFAGQSQGAGMAAYIAKGQPVARVILFSSPWDFFVSNGKLQTMAPWLATPSRTPPERWFGGYHARENQANLLTKSYATLRIPPQNIRVFKGNLPPSQGGKKDPNPFHGEGLYDPAYEQDRAFFLGRSPWRPE
jgi:dienelactone hydrolase